MSYCAIKSFISEVVGSLQLSDEWRSCVRIENGLSLRLAKNLYLQHLALRCSIVVVLEDQRVTNLGALKGQGRHVDK